MENTSLRPAELVGSDQTMENSGKQQSACSEMETTGNRVTNGYGYGYRHIILYTWMNARPRHILEYTDKYASIFPSASQLVVTSSFPDLTVRGHNSQRSRFQTAVEILHKTIRKSPIARILVHIFAGGGANTACHVATELRDRFGLMFSVTALVLDSSPGLGTYKTSLRGIVSSIPSSALIRAIVVPLTHIYLSTVWVLESIFGLENIVKRRRFELTDANLFPPQASRLYLYSNFDQFVPCRGVEKHIQASKSLGLKAESLRFDSSPHVGHSQKHECRYWNSVQSLWLAAHSG